MSFCAYFTQIIRAVISTLNIVTTRTTRKNRTNERCTTSNIGPKVSYRSICRNTGEQFGLFSRKNGDIDIKMKIIQDLHLVKPPGLPESGGRRRGIGGILRGNPVVNRLAGVHGKQRHDGDQKGHHAGEQQDAATLITRQLSDFGFQ